MLIPYPPTNRHRKIRDLSKPGVDILYLCFPTEGRSGNTSFGFCNELVLRKRVISPSPNPNLGGQGISLRLVSTLRPVRHGWPYQEYNTPADIPCSRVIDTHKLDGVGIEEVLNSRPLPYVDDELRDLLTPSQLVIGRRLLSAEESISQPRGRFTNCT